MRLNRPLWVTSAIVASQQRIVHTDMRCSRVNKVSANQCEVFSEQTHTPWQSVLCENWIYWSEAIQQQCFIFLFYPSTGALPLFFTALNSTSPPLCLSYIRPVHPSSATQILLRPTGVQSATFLSSLWLSGRPESFTWEAASPPPLTTTPTTTNPHTSHQPSVGPGGKHKEGRQTENVLKSANDSAQANETVVK